MVLPWRSEDSLCVLVLSLQHMDIRDPIQVIGHGGGSTHRVIWPVYKPVSNGEV